MCCEMSFCELFFFLQCNEKLTIRGYVVVTAMKRSNWDRWEFILQLSFHILCSLLGQPSFFFYCGKLYIFSGVLILSTLSDQQ